VKEAERTVRLLWAQVAPYSYWGGVTMETPTSNMFFDISNPSELMVGIEKHKLPLARAILKELAILIVVLVVFFGPIPKTFLPFAIIPVVIMVALFPALGLVAVTVGLIIDAGVLVLAQEARTPEAPRAGPWDLYAEGLAALRRVNRPSFFVVIAVALSFLPMFSPQEKLNARVVEVTRQPPAQVVWQLDVSGQESYRTVHLPSLYPEVQW
jgi:hypothetical protein